MKNCKLILLLALAIAMILMLTSCNFHFTITGTLPTTPEETTVLVVSSGGSWIYGYIYINEVNTGIYLLPWQTKRIYNISCYQNVKVRLVDENYFSSHTEETYTKPGLNYINFNYWW